MFKKADEEFFEMAKELYLKHHTEMELEVHPSMVMFLRSDKKKEGAFAYCRAINGEFVFLTDKKFIITIVSENFDTLKTLKEKQYVILHEMKHLSCREDKNGNLKYRLFKHNIENFAQLVINPDWKLEAV